MINVNNNNITISYNKNNINKSYGLLMGELLTAIKVVAKALKTEPDTIIRELSVLNDNIELGIKEVENG